MGILRIVCGGYRGGVFAMNFSGPDGIEIAGIRVADTTLIRIGWILPLVSVVCSMTIHAASGHARDFPFFVSESDYPGLERWFFTIGLALTSPLICLLSHRVNVRFKSERTTAHEVSFFAGLASSVSLFVLAMANMYDQLLLHSFSVNWFVRRRIHLGCFNPLDLHIKQPFCSKIKAGWAMVIACWISRDEPQSSVLCSRSHHVIEFFSRLLNYGYVESIATGHQLSCPCRIPTHYRTDDDAGLYWKRPRSDVVPNSKRC